MREAMPDNGLTIRPPDPCDHLDWRELFDAYAHAGGISLTAGQVDRVWSWVVDATAQTRCLLARLDTRTVGLVHFRAFERPITASSGLWIDDLYVHPSARGAGVARALVDAVRRRAHAEGHDVVRWTTRESNVAAHRLYERIAARAPVVVYNAEPVG